MMVVPVMIGWAALASGRCAIASGNVIRCARISQPQRSPTTLTIPLPLQTLVRDRVHWNRTIGP